jgi:hypothetical protein
MVGEQTIGAQFGYFAAMRYNPNNLTDEGSPKRSGNRKD